MAKQINASKVKKVHILMLVNMPVEKVGLC